MTAVPDLAAPAGAAPVRSATSHLLGELTLTESQCFDFPEGLHGFESLRGFALLPTGHEGFWWLQSLEDAGVLFVLADPFRVQPGYAVDIGGEDARFLGLADSEAALVLTVVTLPTSSGGVATTNLRGPVVFNTAARRGRQVVSAVEGHGLQVPVVLPAD
jgi:flagellar assembly factor FliW